MVIFSTPSASSPVARMSVAYDIPLIAAVSRAAAHVSCWFNRGSSGTMLRAGARGLGLRPPGTRSVAGGNTNETVPRSRIAAAGAIRGAVVTAGAGRVAPKREAATRIEAFCPSLMLQSPSGVVRERGYPSVPRGRPSGPNCCLPSLPCSSMPPLSTRMERPGFSAPSSS